MSLQHMILGILHYGPASGYELNKAFKASVAHFWNTEQSQIYRALYKLRDEGWLRVEEVEQSGVPDKKVYTITDSGAAEFNRWVAEPRPLTPFHDAWVGQVFFGANVDRAGFARLLRDRAARLWVEIELYKSELPKNSAHYAQLYGVPDHAVFWELSVRYGLRKLECDLEWTLETLASIEAGNV